MKEDLEKLLKAQEGKRVTLAAENTKSNEEEVKETQEEKDRKLFAQLPRPGQFSKFLAQSKKKVDVRAIRRKQTDAAQKMVEDKTKLARQLQAFKQEQQDIFAGAPEVKKVVTVPTISQGESSYIEQDS